MLEKFLKLMEIFAVLYGGLVCGFLAYDAVANVRRGNFSGAILFAAMLIACAWVVVRYARSLARDW